MWSCSSNGTYIQWNMWMRATTPGAIWPPFPTWPARMVLTAGEVKLQVAEATSSGAMRAVITGPTCSHLSALEVWTAGRHHPPASHNPDTNEWEVSYDKGANWVSLQVSATGQDGREVELRNNGTYIQWRYVGEDDNAWRNLAALSDLVGPCRPGRCRWPGWPGRCRRP